MSNFKKILESLENGIVPDELNFSLQVQDDDNIDWAKLQFNTFYNTEHHIKENIIPKCLHKLPGIDLIIEDLQKNTLSPLEEIELRQSIKTDDENISINNIENVKD